jgi:DNA-binding transcriptional regulator/RsmH inhibitor MraZ
MRRATLKDIADYGKLKDILAVLTFRFILPVKFSKELTEQHVNRLVGNVLGLYVLSGIVALSANHQGLDVEEALTRCFRRALAISVKKAGVGGERAVGISAKSAQTRVFFLELVELLKVKGGGKVSKIDEKWRVAMPSAYAKYVFSWRIGKKTRVVPYPTKKYGAGFLVVGECQDKKRRERERQAMIETCLNAMESFASEVGKDGVFRPEDLERGISESRDFAQILPKDITDYLAGLNVREIIALNQLRGNFHIENNYRKE